MFCYFPKLFFRKKTNNELILNNELLWDFGYSEVSGHRKLKINCKEPSGWVLQIILVGLPCEYPLPKERERMQNLQSLFHCNEIDCAWNFALGPKFPRDLYHNGTVTTVAFWCIYALAFQRVLETLTIWTLVVSYLSFCCFSHLES